MKVNLYCKSTSKSFLLRSVSTFRSPKKIIKTIFVGGLILLFSGCLSLYTYDESKQTVALRKATMDNNEAAIRAVRLGDDGIGFGIDITKLEVLKEQPVKQIASLIGDALLVYGTYEGIRYLSNTDNSSDSSNNQDSGRDSNQVTIDGDGNSVHIGEYTVTEIKEASEDSEVEE